MARKAKEKTVRVWVARDKHTLEIWLFRDKPIKFDDDYFWSDLSEDGTEDNCFKLEDEMFPDVTFENSPQLVEIKLVNNL